MRLRSSARRWSRPVRVHHQHRVTVRVGVPDARFYDHLDAEPPFLKPPAYGASKAALVNLTRYPGHAWGPSGVRVNALSPGGVEGGQDPEFKRKFTSRVPLGRMAATRISGSAYIPRIGRLVRCNRYRTPGGRWVYRLVNPSTEAAPRWETFGFREFIPNFIDGKEIPARSGECFFKRAPATGGGARRGRPLESRRCRRRHRRGSACTTGLGRRDGRQSGRSAQVDRARPARAARRSGPARRRRNGKVDEGRPRRDQRRHRNGNVHRRRGPAILWPDHHECGSQQVGAYRAPTPRRRRADHRGQHADRQRRLESVSGAALRQRSGAQGRRRHAAERLVLRPDRLRGRPAARRAQCRARIR